MYHVYVICLLLFPGLFVCRCVVAVLDCCLLPVVCVYGIVRVL